VTRPRSVDRGIATAVAWITWLAFSTAAARAETPGATGATPDRPDSTTSVSPDSSISTLALDEPAAPDSTHLAAAFPAGLPPAPPSRLRLPTESRLLLELGQRTDVTNELYIDYQDAFIDSTAIGNDARWVGTPEARTAAMMSAVLTGPRERSFRYRSATELELGNKVQRVTAVNGMTWGALSPWSLGVDPAFEYRHDRTFGLDREELRASLGTRVRRTSLDGLTSGELTGWGDVLRANGDGSQYLLDRNAIAVGLGFNREEFAGGSLHAGVRSNARAFPDSIHRDHFEHSGELEWRGWIATGGMVGLGITAVRRIPQHAVASSRDDFWYVEGLADTEVPLRGPFRLRLNGGAEIQRYQRPDSTVEFDYTLSRAAVALVWSSDPRWRIALGPRIERFAAVQSPEDGYWEAAGAADFEWIGGGAWWTVAPSAGWRAMDDPPADAFVASSFAFVALELFADQPIAAGWVARAGASVRIEDHTDASQGSRSLHGSLELRWRMRR
jgi:hypothetical protein